MPRIQDELLKATGKTELGKNLNTDEAAALGAVYQAAFMSKGYKVKKFYIKDINLYPIQVEFERVVEESDEDDKASTSTEPPSKLVKRVLFDRFNAFPQKKVMTFSKHTRSFTFSVQYGDLSQFMSSRDVQIMGTSNELAVVSLANVDEVFSKHDNEENRGIKVHFRMDNSGILHIDSVDVTFEKKKSPSTDGDKDAEPSTLSKIGDTISSFFTGSSTKTTPDDNKVSNDDTASPDAETTPATSDTTADKAKSTTPSPTANDTATNKTSDDSKATTAPPAAGKGKANATGPTTKLERIKYETVDVDLMALEAAQLEETRARLNTIKQKELEKRKRRFPVTKIEPAIRTEPESRSLLKK